MKHFLTIFSAAVFWSCSVLAGNVPDYKIVIIGDLHFDGAACHKFPLQGERAAARMKQVERNCRMWQGTSQALLKDAAKHLDDAVPFVIQTGDITQGDCDTAELHKQMFRDAFNTTKGLLKNRRFLGVTGNHDVRLGDNSFSREAVTNAYLPLIAKEAGLPELKTGNFSLMHGPDLFLFIESFQTPKGAAAEFLKKELKTHPDTRYVFLVTHIPVFPMDPAVPDPPFPDHLAVRDLLMSRNAVILAGHTHVFSHIVYRDGAGRTLPQLVTTSLGSHWAPDRAFQKELSGFDSFCKAAEKCKHAKPVRFRQEYPLDSLPEFTIFTKISGYSVLEVNDAGVTARICTGKPEPVLTIPLISKRGIR